MCVPARRERFDISTGWRAQGRWHAARIRFCRGPTFMGSMMSRTFEIARAVCAALALIVAAGAAEAASRIKDLANIEGVRQNQLIGYGLVVGLNGTGDT